MTVAVIRCEDYPRADELSAPGIQRATGLVWGGPPRDVAASYFHHLAAALTNPDAAPALLVLADYAPVLPLPLQRMLDRALLAAGGGRLQPATGGAGAWGGGSQASPLAYPPTGRLWRRSGEPGRHFPAPPPPPAPLPAYRAGPVGWVNRGPGAGAFRPGVRLLVGERPGVARSGQLKHRLPFVSFDGGGCAGWLAEQLERAGVAEADLYWINAYDALGVPTNSAFVDALQPAQIIALGKEAKRWCKASDLPHRCVPHPQYWKRFRSKERYPLLDVL